MSLQPQENLENPSLATEMEGAPEETVHQNTCDANPDECTGVEASVVEAVLENITEVVVELDETLTGRCESVQLEEVVVECPPNEAENEIVVTSPAKDSCTPSSSSPIEIANPSR